jgi:dolichyl-diphosphooligosaccharide--protein glycosyltransferase
MSRFNIRSLPSANVLYGSALASIFAIALFLRTYFPYDNVFAGDWVRFKWYDSWYHMRLVENLAHHFPSRIQFDPYTFYPHGQDVFFAPFPDLLLGFFIWIFGAGSPSQQLIETLGVYFPAVLGALVAIPVFFLGKELFNKKVGLLAAALVIILPGQFLLRSLLGYTDHHVIETLLSSLSVLFLILALKNAKQTGISFNNLRARDWASLKKPVLYSLLAGITLGLYLLSWAAGAFFIFILLVFALLQYISDHLRGRQSDYLCVICVPAFFIALIMVLPFRGQFGMGDLQIAALLIGALGLPLLSGISQLINRRRLRRIYYPLIITSLLGIAFAVLNSIAPSLFDSIIDELGRFKPAGVILTIGEVVPLTLSIAWEEFTTSFYLALISLALLAYYVIKEGAHDKMLLLIWSLLMLLATFGQNRFAYYFAVNAALLTAYLSWKSVAFISAKLAPVLVTSMAAQSSKKLRSGMNKSKSSKKGKRKKARAGKRRWRALVAEYPIAKYAYGAAVALILFFLVYFPNIGMAVDTAGQASLPDEEWHDALLWMRDSENTPEPFGEGDFFYELYERPPDGVAYEYPESAYGIMAWWDYGHWITDIAHRIPNANPHQAGASDAARFFTAQDEASANRMLDELGSRYVIANLMTSLHEINPEAETYGNFSALLRWTGKDDSDYFDLYYKRTSSDELIPVVLYYPEFYRAMSSRLYIFDGQSVKPDNTTWIISYSEEISQEDIEYREITSELQFATYEEAVSFRNRQSDPDSYKIVGKNQFVSPVPLEKLERYTLVYESSPTGGANISKVKIFDYTP